MDITKTLQPGDMGTLQLLKQYGEQLICVRYRVDKKKMRRLTTVEIVVEDKPYQKRTPALIAWVKINYDETTLRQQVKAAGAKWLMDDKVWEMDYSTARKLGLKKRIVKRMAKLNGLI